MDWARTADWSALLMRVFSFSRTRHEGLGGVVIVLAMTAPPGPAGPGRGSGEGVDPGAVGGRPATSSPAEMTEPAVIEASTAFPSVLDREAFDAGLRPRRYRPRGWGSWSRTPRTRHVRQVRGDRGVFDPGPHRVADVVLRVGRTPCNPARQGDAAGEGEDIGRLFNAVALQLVGLQRIAQGALRVGRNHHVVHVTDVRVGAFSTLVTLTSHGAVTIGWIFASIVPAISLNVSDTLPEAKPTPAMPAAKERMMVVDLAETLTMNRNHRRSLDGSGLWVPIKFLAVATPAAPRSEPERPMAIESILEVSVAVRSIFPVPDAFRIPELT